MAKLTRQHYQSLAETIRFLDVENDDKCRVVNDMISFCKRWNSAFKEDRFREACGQVCREGIWRFE